MNYIIIDDNEDFAKELKTKLGIKAVHTEHFSQNVDKLAKKINKINKLNETDCLCINSEVLINKNAKRIDYSGIELLKILRIKHRFLKPIIVYGFTALDDLLQNQPEHLILTAKANKYLQLPITNQNIKQQAEILKPITEDSLVKSYKNVLSSDSTIRDISHSFANEYGLELMCRAHQGVTNQILNISVDNEGKLKSLMAKAEFLYDYEKNKNLRDESKLLRNKLIKHIKTNASKILCIDDQGTDNWFSFYSNLLDDHNNNIFKGFTPKEDFDRVKKQIITCIKNFNPDVVLLDLRLYGDKEEGKRIQDISGYQVLKKIKEKYPALPIVITSATNKSDNLTALLKAKAFGLWTKPRIEQGNIDIYEKYYSLVEIIYDALTHYEFEDEKIPIRTDYLINQIENIDHLEALNYYLNKYDLIITDTNCWMQGVRVQSGVDKVAKLNKNLYLTSKIVGTNFLIIDDVKRELSEHLHKISKSNKEKNLNKKKSIRAQYGIELLNKIITEESIFVYDFHLLHYNIGHRFKFWYKKKDETSINEYCSFKDTIGKKGNDDNNTKDDKKIFSRMFYKGLTDTNPNSKLNCDNIIKELNKRTKVHADPYFVNIIFNYLITNNDQYKKRNILFITEDKDCADQVYFYIKESLGYEEEQNKKTIEKHNIEKVVSGIFKGKIDDEVFSLTIKKPFQFSEEIEKLINEN